MTARQRAADTTRRSASGVAVGLPVVLIWIAGHFGLELPVEVASSIAGMVGVWAGKLGD